MYTSYICAYVYMYACICVYVQVYTYIYIRLCTAESSISTGGIFAGGGLRTGTLYILHIYMHNVYILYR